VTAMAWSTTLHGDTGSTVATAVTMSVIGLGSAVPAVLCWTAVLRTGQAWGGPAEGMASRRPVGERAVPAHPGGRDARPARGGSR
jgi:hypothetical protein